MKPCVPTARLRNEHVCVVWITPCCSGFERRTYLSLAGETLVQPDASSLTNERPEQQPELREHYSTAYRKEKHSMLSKYIQTLQPLCKALS